MGTDLPFDVSPLVLPEVATALFAQLGLPTEVPAEPRGHRRLQGEESVYEGWTRWWGSDTPAEGAWRLVERHTEEPRSSGGPAHAIDNLREGMREMGEDLREQAATEGGQQGQVDGTSTAQNGGRDPLGRPIGQSGGVGTNEQMLPEGDSAARARELRLARTLPVMAFCDMSWANMGLPRSRS